MRPAFGKRKHAKLKADTVHAELESLLDGVEACVEPIYERANTCGAVPGMNGYYSMLVVALRVTQQLEALMRARSGRAASFQAAGTSQAAPALTTASSHTHTHTHTHSPTNTSEPAPSATAANSGGSSRARAGTDDPSSSLPLPAVLALATHIVSTSLQSGAHDMTKAEEPAPTPQPPPLLTHAVALAREELGTPHVTHARTHAPATAETGPDDSQGSSNQSPPGLSSPPYKMPRALRDPSVPPAPAPSPATAVLTAATALASAALALPAPALPIAGPAEQAQQPAQLPSASSSASSSSSSSSFYSSSAASVAPNVAGTPTPGPGSPTSGGLLPAFLTGWMPDLHEREVTGFLSDIDTTIKQLAVVHKLFTTTKFLIDNSPDIFLDQESETLPLVQQALTLPTECFFGVRFCPQYPAYVQRVMRFVMLARASFASAKQLDNSLLRAGMSLVYGGYFSLFPRDAAERFVTVQNDSNMHELKQFWNIAETPLTEHALAATTSTRLSVDKELYVSPARLQVTGGKGQPVFISPPSLPPSLTEGLEEPAVLYVRARLLIHPSLPVNLEGLDRETAIAFIRAQQQQSAIGPRRARPAAEKPSQQASGGRWLPSMSSLSLPSMPFSASAAQQAAKQAHVQDPPGAHTRPRSASQGMTSHTYGAVSSTVGAVAGLAENVLTLPFSILGKLVPSSPRAVQKGTASSAHPPRAASAPERVPPAGLHRLNSFLSESPPSLRAVPVHPNRTDSAASVEGETEGSPMIIHSLQPVQAAAPGSHVNTLPAAAGATVTGVAVPSEAPAPAAPTATDAMEITGAHPTHAAHNGHCTHAPHSTHTTPSGTQATPTDASTAATSSAAPSAPSPSSPSSSSYLSAPSFLRRMTFAGGGSTAEEPSRLLIIYLHGGGFVAQSVTSFMAHLKEWARETRAPIVCVEYRKAPEYPYPIAFQECYYAYIWAVANCRRLGSTGEHVVLIGDSAGGNLAAAVTNMTIVQDTRVPNSLVLVYPSLYLRYVPSPSRLLSVLDPLLTVSTVRDCFHAYLPPDKKLPHADQYSDFFLSPAAAPDDVLAKYPRTLITVGTMDPLLDDSAYFAKRLEELQVPTTLRIYDEFPHGFLNLGAVVGMGARPMFAPVHYIVEWVMKNAASQR